MKRTTFLALAVVGCLAAGAAAAQEPLDETTLGESRGGLQTPMGGDIGFGATVRTYVDGSLALETQLTWTPQGARSERVFQSDAARALDPDGASRSSGAPVTVGVGTRVIHDLTTNHIASVILNSANDRVLRQETNVTLVLPQLPDLQQRVALERLSQGLDGLSPSATGVGH